MDFLTVKEIVDATKGEPWRLSLSQKVKGISVDSRTIKKGELFIALKGEEHDGHRFVGEALRKGAAASLVSKHIKCKTHLIKVKNTLKALGDIAKEYRKRYFAQVVAITGTM